VRAGRCPPEPSSSRLVMTTQLGRPVMRCHPVHGRPTGSEHNSEERFRWLSLVVGLPGLEPGTSSLSEQRHRQTGPHPTALSLVAPQVRRCSQPLIVRCCVALSWFIADNLLTATAIVCSRPRLAARPLPFATDWWRLRLVRGWSHDQTGEVSAGAARAGRSASI
jgi:hypothetical protein